MPIRAENRDRYPADWRDIRNRILLRACNRCEECGVENHALGGRDSVGQWHAAWPEDCSGTMPRPGMMALCDGRRMLRIIRIVLTIAHRDHTPENCAEDNLRALCQRCHLRYDAKMHQSGMKARRREALGVGELFGAKEAR